MKLLNEKLAINEYIYPFAEKNNSLLYSYIQTLPRGENNTGVVKSLKLTPRNLHLDSNNEIQSLLKWINQLLDRDFIRRSHPMASYQHNPSVGLKCNEMWALVCDKGDSIDPHTHSPNAYTFTYYVNTPKGSSPIIFPISGHRIKAEAGKLVIFEGRLIHAIPPNKCEGRCIIGGCIGL